MGNKPAAATSSLSTQPPKLRHPSGLIIRSVIELLVLYDLAEAEQPHCRACDSRASRTGDMCARCRKQRRAQQAAKENWANCISHRARRQLAQLKPGVLSCLKRPELLTSTSRTHRQPAAIRCTAQHGRQTTARPAPSSAPDVIFSSRGFRKVAMCCDARVRNCNDNALSLCHREGEIPRQAQTNATAKTTHR